MRIGTSALAWIAAISFPAASVAQEPLAQTAATTGAHRPAPAWDRYAIRYWPSFVLIDKRGRIRYEGAGEFHVGDRTYRVWEQRIQALLAERDG
jgi:hypothetical protein